MRFERSVEAQFPASLSSAGKIESELTSIGVPPSVARRTKDHESTHLMAYEGAGEFRVRAKAEVSSGRLVASWVASFIPNTQGVDTESPEFFLQMIRTAEAVGGEMSEQDKFVASLYKEKYGDWLASEKYKPVEDLFGEEREEDEPTPFTEIIRKFAEKIDDLVEEDRFPSLEELMKETPSEILVKHRSVLIDAYYKACLEVGYDPRHEPSGFSRKLEDQEKRAAILIKRDEESENPDGDSETDQQELYIKTPSGLIFSKS